MRPDSTYTDTHKHNTTLIYVCRCCVVWTKWLLLIEFNRHRFTTSFRTSSAYVFECSDFILFSIALRRVRYCVDGILEFSIRIEHLHYTQRSIITRCVAQFIETINRESTGIYVRLYPRTIVCLGINNNNDHSCVPINRTNRNWCLQPDLNLKQFESVVPRESASACAIVSSSVSISIVVGWNCGRTSMIDRVLWRQRKESHPTRTNIKIRIWCGCTIRFGCCCQSFPFRLEYQMRPIVVYSRPSGPTFVV